MRCLCCAVCWRCHVLIGGTVSSTGVIGEEKNAKRTEMENKINDESKKTRTHTYHRYLVPGTSPNTSCLVVLCLFQRKHRAPLCGRLMPPATLAQGRMQLKHVNKGGGKMRPVIIWCEQRSDNAKRCLRRANCPALWRVLVDVTF